MYRLTRRRVAAVVAVTLMVVGLLAAAVAQRNFVSIFIGALVAVALGMLALNRRLLWAVRSEGRRANRTVARELSLIRAELKRIPDTEAQLEQAIVELRDLESRVSQVDRARDSRTAAQFDWIARRYRKQEEELEKFLEGQETMLREQSEQAQTMQQLILGGIENVGMDVARQTRRMDEVFAKACTDLEPLITAMRTQHDALAAIRTYQNAYGTRKSLLADISALLSLYGDFTGPSPVLGDWSMAPRSLERMRREVLRLAPSTVLELGSGSSTPFLGKWAQDACPESRVVSIEHDLHHYSRTMDMLSFLNVGGVSLELAALSSVTIDEAEYAWYDINRETGPIDLLVVDGPPGGSGRLARFPAVPLLAHALRPGSRVLLDDANREDERMCIELWTSRPWSGRQLIHVETVDGLAVLEVAIHQDPQAVQGTESA